MFESVARQTPSRKGMLTSRLSLACRLFAYASLSFPDHMTPCRCVAQNSLARTYTTHRKLSSHRHTEISLRLQHIGEDQYSWRCDVRSGEAGPT
jgi:hypothetical protein